MPVIGLTMYGPVIGQCAPKPMLGSKLNTFVAKSKLNPELRLVLTYFLANCELEK